MGTTRETRQKKLMQKELHGISTFFTAEEFFSKVNVKDRKIGIATAYRFLKQLRKEGKGHSFICNKKILYSTRGRGHCHFICEKCGNVEHLNLKSVDFLKEALKRNICHFQLDIHGLCGKCKKQNMGYSLDI